MSEELRVERTSIGKLVVSATGLRDVADWLEQTFSTNDDCSVECLLECVYDNDDILKRTLRFQTPTLETPALDESKKEES